MLDVPVGIALPPLVGVDSSGERLQLPFQEGTTVLFVFDPDCQHCQANWRNWEHIIAIAPPSVRFAVIDLSNTGARRPERKRTRTCVEVHRIDPVSAQVYRLGRTPQTLVMRADRTVAGVWTGELTEPTIAEIMATLTSPKRTMS